MVEIQNLHKSYGSLQALRGISLNVPKGQILGLLGPNGAGKSTALRILTGFLEASLGHVSVGGYSVSEQGLESRKLIGYLPESTPLYENMLVYDYLHFIAKMRGTPQPGCAEKIVKAARRCDIVEFIHRPIGELSKGQRQRVGLAMAILDDPQVLVLDEPTSGLDPNQIIGIRSIIRELGREKTIIFSTHILSEAEAICDRVVIISKGQIVADGSVEELKQNQSGQPSLSLRIESDDANAVQEAFGAARRRRCSVPGPRLRANRSKPKPAKCWLRCMVRKAAAPSSKSASRRLFAKMNGLCSAWNTKATASNKSFAT